MSEVFCTRRVCIAPMLDWTDRHYRYLARLIAQRVYLYSEMINVNALIYGDTARFLAFDPSEMPVALQLGGSEREKLQQCARLAMQWGYDEVNLNVGCPSERVQSGAFGACLMREAVLVADLLCAMQDRAGMIPVTVKHRIGVDAVTDYAFVRDFVGTLAQRSPCRVFIVHARNAILQGLSPKENREIPPLKYAYVHQLKADFPHLETVINGGITQHTAVQEHLQFVDGVMIGREAYHNPYWLARVDGDYYGLSERVALSRLEVAQQYFAYAERQFALGVPLLPLARPLLGLFHGCAGGRAWRRHLSDAPALKREGLAVFARALAAVSTPQE